jgi:hypothetical protein
MRLHLEPVDQQHPHRVALMYGPVVLVRNQEPRLVPQGNDVSSWIVSGEKPLEFSSAGPPQGSFVPFYQVGQGTPYNMYFDLKV